MTEINLAYYQSKDWKRFLESIDDRESMHKTWRQWHKSYNKLKKKLTSAGITVNDIIIDIDELSAYCKAEGIKNDGKARSQFVSRKR